MRDYDFEIWEYLMKMIFDPNLRRWELCITKSKALNIFYHVNTAQVSSYVCFKVQRESTPKSKLCFSTC